MRFYSTENSFYNKTKVNSKKILQKVYLTKLPKTSFCYFCIKKKKNNWFGWGVWGLFVWSGFFGSQNCRTVIIKFQLNSSTLNTCPERVLEKGQNFNPDKCFGKWRCRILIVFSKGKCVVSKQIWHDGR